MNRGLDQHIVGLLRRQRLRGRPSCPVGSSVSSTTFRRTRSRATARFADRFRHDRIACSVACSTWGKLPPGNGPPLGDVERGPNSERSDHYSQGMATRVAAWLAAASFFIVAAFQAALAFGAPWGEYTQGGGTSGVLASSGRLFAAVSCVLSIVMAGAILARAGEGPLQRFPARVVTVLAWVATVYSAVAVVLNIYHHEEHG